ncbi:MAG: N-acetylmuramoyl-L-alanine amidase [Firmicutes bacterium]|nr:N-acetylmuramoyl-L-alanine amidase [Bacillota bacterium]
MRIVIDPGHGGHDPGSVHFNRRESDDNLRLALAVRDRLIACGQIVLMTRTTDTFVPLLERSQISNNQNADFFLSLHRNGSTNPAAAGVDIFVRPSPSNREVSIAQSILNNIVLVGVQSNRGLKRENFSVLRNTRAPAALLELGFMSNAADNNLFDINFNRYVDAIVFAISAAFSLNCAAPLTPVNPPVNPPPPITPTPPPNDQRELMRQIQSTLNSRYGQTLNADGICGPLTQAAIIRGLQTELNRLFNANLPITGVFGPLTRAAIRPLRRGDRGNYVWILQAALTCNGVLTTPDGNFGPLTENSVRAFQSSRGLGVDGIAGPITFTALLGN